MKTTLLKLLPVLLVIGVSTATFATSPRYEIKEDASGATVVDHATSLMWEQKSELDGSVTWSEALRHCEALEKGGFSDWRLPNITEMLSLVDEKKAVAPAINTTYFTNFVGGSGHWTSTTHRTQAQAAYVVYFNEQNTTVGRGGVGGQTKTFKALTLCVRTH